jgi:hypothetical protein
VKKLSDSYFSDIRGVVYIPTRAYNAYQMWRDYSGEVIKRDLGYARLMNFNALRIWLSFEYWKEHKEQFAAAFEDFLNTAAGYGLKVMPSLFECCGREPYKENIDDMDPITGTAVRSPGSIISNDPDLWYQPKEFVDWFMDTYRNDERLLAIEAINEPKPNFPGDFRFAEELVRWIAAKKGKIPITLGAGSLTHNIPFIAHGIDILQQHANFVVNVNAFKRELKFLKLLEEENGIPCWITEWQRVRKSGIGWDEGDKIDKADTLPDHSSMAPVFKELGLGNFMWSLMIKPAYLTKQRLHGTISGIFHEDGSVYSLEDARAVSGNMELKLVENRAVPEMFKAVRALVGE